MIQAISAAEMVKAANILDRKCNNETLATLNAYVIGSIGLDALKTEEKYILNEILEIRTKEALTALQAAKYGHIAPHHAMQIEVGAILYSSWGYDQTNVDFYCIVEVSKSFIKMLPMGHDYTPNGSMDGSVMPIIVDFSAEVMRRKFDPTGKKHYIKADAHIYCKLWDGKTKYTSNWA